MSDWKCKLDKISTNEDYHGVLIMLTDNSDTCRSRYYSSGNNKSRFYYTIFKDGDKYSIYRSTKTGIPFKSSGDTSYSNHSNYRKSQRLYFVHDYINSNLRSGPSLFTINEKVVIAGRITLSIDPNTYRKVLTKDQEIKLIERKINTKKRTISRYNYLISNTEYSLSELKSELRSLK